MQFSLEDSPEFGSVLLLLHRGTMRPKKHNMTGSDDPFRARLIACRLIASTCRHLRSCANKRPRISARSRSGLVVTMREQGGDTQTLAAFVMVVFAITSSMTGAAAQAPAKLAQFPNLLRDYSVRPSWMVAGVDYAVGIPAGTALTGWETLSGPGITVNLANHSVTVYRTSNVTISDVDFSRDGGAIFILSVLRMLRSSIVISAAQV